VRDGIALQPAGPPPTVAVLLAGLDDRLPRDAANFLRRTGVVAVHVARLGEVLGALQKTRPLLLVITSEVLGDAPLQTLGLLRQHGARTIAVVADAARAQALSGHCEILDAGVAPAVLLDLISTRLSLSRRSSARVRCVANVATVRPEGRVEAVLENLSLGGLLMSSPDAFAVGERFVVEFVLPDRCGRVNGVARAVRVLRSGPYSAAVKVGVVFERLDDDSPEALRRYVQAHLTEEALRQTGETPAPFRISLTPAGGIAARPAAAAKAG
jgi:Tfp pilus assembly protein PilZ